MLNEIDIDTVMRAAGALWVILIGLFTLILSLLAFLLPFFVWRILHWSRMSAQELSHLNSRMEYLLTYFASVRGRGEEIGEFIFSRPEEAERKKNPNVRERNFARKARSVRRRGIISRFPPRFPRSWH